MLLMHMSTPPSARFSSSELSDLTTSSLTASSQFRHLPLFSPLLRPHATSFGLHQPAQAGSRPSRASYFSVQQLLELGTAGKRTVVGISLGDIQGLLGAVEVG